MVEVAIALAVIAFALVAILGVLPMGMEIQRDNRQDTIINHDGTYLLEAIRGGAQGLDDLTNYVDSIAVNNRTYTFGNPTTTTFTYGSNIVALLTAPDAVAIMRAISGSAASKGPGMKDLTMRYQVLSQIRPALALTNIDPSVLYATNLAANLYDVRLMLRWPVHPRGPNQWVLSKTPNHQVFRTVVSGTVNDGLLNIQSFRPEP